MIKHLKCYQCVLRTLGPVFVGSGREIGKREYIFLNQNKVGIPDIQKLYMEMQRRGIGELFEEYLLGFSNMGLTDWLKKQGIRLREIEPMINYALDCGDAVFEKGDNKLKVMECIKDPFGKPYIPGSSIKGMFRTILLGEDMLCSPQKYQGVKKELLQNAEVKKRPLNYLKSDVASFEAVAYRTLRRQKTRPNDAVNDVLQGMVVSDSEPLPLETLVLCQKIDLHTKGIERLLPLLRECIKPDVKIRFTITVDTDICQITDARIMSAVKKFAESYYQNFGAAFQKIEKPKENDVFLGGGCGYVSKTVLYPLLGKKLGMETVQKVFENTNVPRVHKHHYDLQYGASPHTLKCTKYQGKNYQMGLCKIESLKCVG